MNTVDFGLSSWFSSFERKGSRWKPYNQLPGSSAGSLVFVAVPKTRIFGQSLASSSHNSQTTGNIWKERRSTLSVRAQNTDSRKYELSDLEDIEFSWEDPAVNMDSVYRPGIDTPFSPSIFDDFQMEGSTAANPKKLTMTKKRRIQLQQQHQSLSVQPKPLDYWEVLHSGLD